ncbi:MAG TPA: sulfite exporter TauE/SafE family protein, partial [Vicinamibacterales bacterium]
LILSAALSLMNGRLRLEPSSRGLGRITRLLQRRVPAHPFVLGVVLGLLPCGLLYSAVTAAVARGTPAAGAFALAVFAAGTTPSLLGIAFARHQLTRHATRFVSLSQAFVLVMGIWYFWRGIGS